MHPSLCLYNLAAGVGSLALPAFFLASALNSGLRAQRPRLGLQSHLPFTPAARRGVWMQAVSVGEVQVADAIAQALWKQGFSSNLTITSTTPHGLAAARKRLGLQAQVAPFPLDFAWAVGSAVRRLRPKVYVSLETEIWPNLLWALHCHGIKIIMLNGRISRRSFPRYMKIRPLMASCLNLFTCLNMISELDAERVIALGANPARVQVGGNAKYGILQKKANASHLGPVLAGRLRTDSLLVAGSVRGGEQRPVVQAFKQVLQKQPQAVLLCAPRHTRYADVWLAEAAGQGIPAVLWSRMDWRKPETKIVILDEMGLLFDFYGLAKGAFVGASLVDKGGQNPLEPAAWGVPIAFGPHMEDFKDATGMLLPAAAVQVENAPQLADFWLNCLEDDNFAARLGQKAATVVSGLGNAAEQCANLIMRCFNDAT